MVVDVLIGVVVAVVVGGGVVVAVILFPVVVVFYVDMDIGTHTYACICLDIGLRHRRTPKRTNMDIGKHIENIEHIRQFKAPPQPSRGPEWNIISSFGLRVLRRRVWESSSLSCRNDPAAFKALAASASD